MRFARSANDLAISTRERAASSGEVASRAITAMQEMVQPANVPLTSSELSMESPSRQIAVATDEQAVGIEQINQALVHMDSVTQQNAA